MQENVVVDKVKGGDFIGRERRLSLMAGVGYGIAIFGFVVGNGMTAIGEFKLIVGVCLALLGFTLVFVVGRNESREIKEIRNGNFVLEGEYEKELKEKYGKVKYIYMAVYFLALAGIATIVGRSFYIAFVYKACPNNDMTTFGFGALAMFCYVYASGLMGAYKALLQKK